MEQLIDGMLKLQLGKERPEDDFEYTMGNGQCAYCEGTCPSFGWGLSGHTDECKLATLLEGMGYGDVIMYTSQNKGKYRSPMRGDGRLSEEDYQSGLVRGRTS